MRVRGSFSFVLPCKAKNGNPLSKGGNLMHEEKDILTIQEAAEYLQMGKRSLYKLAKERKIPAKKVLNKFRFVKEDIKSWVSEGK
jgi:excisionase family DNA binding protein